MTNGASADHLGIVELGTICARQRAVGLDLFTTLGSRVIATDDPGVQRLVAEAAHRHAWHAELWAQRTPSIPPVDGDRLTESFRSAAESDADPLDRYDEQLERSIAELGEIAARVDRELDPATHRVVDLVRNDLVDLAARFGARRD